MSLINNQYRINSYDFGLNLTRQIITESVGGNVFFSPATVTFVLAMCYVRANNETKNEMKRNNFGHDFSVDGVQKMSHSILDLFSQYRMFFNAYEIYANYKGEDKYVDFVFAFIMSNVLMIKVNKESVRTVKEINNWIEQIMEQQITKLIIAPGMVEPATAMSLISTLYFHKVWQYQFSGWQTRKHDFAISTSKSVQVDMMYSAERIGWYENDEVQVLELEKFFSPANIVLILPKKRNGLKVVFENLNGKKLAEWIDSITRTEHETEVSIPKYKIEQSFKLNNVLKNIGMVERFADFADFSKMDNDASIKLSDAMQKVDGHGTDATFATYDSISTEKKFVADHPFIFLIMQRTGEKNILFMGQVDGKSQY